MAFSMHSHSGQFCPGHAKDSLEEVIQTAILRGMTIFALTEHMPRLSTTDLYPEEIAAGNSIEDHIPNHEAYLQEAIRLREKYAGDLQILIGFEGEWIRSDYGSLIQYLAADPRVDFFIGSVHHVYEIPIDYDKAFFAKARNVAGGTDEKLYEDYFDLQLEMLEALSPRVVGHFDLIRLLATEPDRDLKSMEGVWKKAVRNLEVVVKQGGLLEINSAGLRKGLKEPYPGRSICEEFLKMGGMLTLSDDSHGIEQVGTNFTRAVDYVESLGVKELWTLEKKSGLQSSGKRKLGVKSVAVSSVQASFRA